MKSLFCERLVSLRVLFFFSCSNFLMSWQCSTLHYQGVTFNDTDENDAEVKQTPHG